MYINSCPVGCTAGFNETDIKMPEGKLLQCSSCGQMISQCTNDQYFSSMEEFDDIDGTMPNASSVKRAFKLHSDRLNLLSKVLNKPLSNMKLLDVGCSSGAFLDTAKKLGASTYGVEPAAKAAQTAKLKGHDVKAAFLQDVGYSDNSFDLITLFEVIEHLKSPKELLDEMYRILKPGGLVMISTGNAKSLTVNVLKERWDYFSINRHGGHISFFNPNSIVSITKQSNFNVEKVITRNIKFANKGEPGKLKYRFLKVLSELLSPIAKRLGVGHDMLIVLRK